MQAKLSKTQREAARLETLTIEKAAKLKLLDSIAKGDDNTILNSASFGPVEVWNLVTCWFQNAEHEKNEPLAHIECQLCDETLEVGAFFRAIGINF